MNEIDQHNLRETKALIAALSHDWPEMEAQLACLDQDGLRVLMLAAYELSHRASLLYWSVERQPPRGMLHG